MPQPKSGRIKRSPFAVPRMTQMDWRTLASYSAGASAPTPFKATGNCQPLPRKILYIASKLLPASADEDRADGDDRPRRQVRGVVTGHRRVAVARGHLAVNLDGRAPDFYRRLVR